MTPTRIRPAALTVALVVSVVMSGCSTSTRLSPLETSDEVYNASSRATMLQSLRAGDTQPLQELLEAWIAGDIKVLGARLKPDAHLPLSGDRRAAAIRTLVILAILNERAPVPQWSGDAEVLGVLNWALVQDARLTASMRSRDWDRSFLRGP